MGTFSFIVNFTLFVLFLSLGIIFRTGRGTSLIAGYNTMKKEQRDKYDTAKLTRFMSLIMFGFAAATSFFLIEGFFPSDFLFVHIGLGIMFIMTVYLFANIANQKKFMK